MSRLGIHLFITVSLCALLGFASSPINASKKKPEVRPIVWDEIKHVVIIIFENTSPIEVVKQPYFRSLMTKGAHLSNYFAITHPSQPNYIAMVAGTTFDVRSDRSVNIRGLSIADLLETKGKSWKAYAEDYPGNCFLKDDEELYVRKHVPFLSFVNIQKNPKRCLNIVPATQFNQDIAQNQLPTYSLYIPNQDNNGHDTDVSFADKWLRTTFSAHFNNENILKDTLFVITFDEDDWFHGNRIYTVFLGAGVLPGATTQNRYDHYSLLRTMEEIFGLGTLSQNDLFADTILDIWK